MNGIVFHSLRSPSLSLHPPQRADVRRSRPLERLWRVPGRPGSRLLRWSLRERWWAEGDPLCEAERERNHRPSG